MRVALSRAYVTYVPILSCVRTHVVDGAYTVNCKTTVRAPVLIKTNQRSIATVCDHCAVCGTVILQACSKYRLRKAVAPEEYASQRLSSVGPPAAPEVHSTRTILFAAEVVL